MNYSVFLEMKFFLLIIFSVVIPVGIYGFLLKKLSISRWTVLIVALSLIVVAAIDVFLLQSMAKLAQASLSTVDDRIFSEQLSITLYLLPALFAGIAINLTSHVLINHLDEAEGRFAREHPGAEKPAAGLRHWFRRSVPGILPELPVLAGSAIAMAGIFILDILTGTQIRLHVLYIFPLALVARYCAKPWLTIAALSLTTVLQLTTFSFQTLSIPTFVTDVAVALAASLLIVFLARTARENHLSAINQATTDPLTNLANRRAFMARMDSEIACQKRYGGVVTLAVLDLDGFKALNDAKGHGTGDEALKLAAQILQSSTRQSDLVARIGGDEFVILMPNTQDIDCGILFHQLCATIAERMAASGFPVTASIGCKTLREPPESSSIALQQADQIMYEAKKGGKNRVAHS